MNLIQRTAMGMLLVTLGAASAGAALSGDADGGGRSIELVDGNAQSEIFDQLLNLGELNETILLRHARSAQPTQTPMNGQYVSEGAELPQLYEQQSLTQSVARYASPEPHSATLIASQASAVHAVGSNAVSVGASAPVMASADSSSGSQIILSVTNGTPGESGNGPTIPIPPSVLMLASGLLALPLTRRRREPAWQ